MNARCPSCDYLFPRSSRGRSLGGLWTPRTATCPSCGARVHWHLLFWRLQILGAVLLVPALLRSLPGPVRLGFAGASIALVLIAMTNLRLERTSSIDRTGS